MPKKQSKKVTGGTGVDVPFEEIKCFEGITKVCFVKTDDIDDLMWEVSFAPK